MLVAVESVLQSQKVGASSHDVIFSTTSCNYFGDLFEPGILVDDWRGWEKNCPAIACGGLAELMQ